MAEGESDPVPLAVKTSDLPVRAASAVVILGIASGALWLGGVIWTSFVVLVAIGVYWEWWRLTRAFTQSMSGQAIWMLAGTLYIGLAAMVLIILRGTWSQPLMGVLMVVGAVIATDVGAYFTGRTFGGPKIAPRISPSKTWSGLVGGMTASGLLMLCVLISRWDSSVFFDDFPHSLWVFIFLIAGALLAVVAQAGDFFESWMKRQAGVKDSGSLIPGHGGLFDRVDGLLAVCFVLSLFWLLGQIPT